jgi:predicted CXXCH cytochrome family protein
MHGPAAVGACDACHDYADPAAHTFTMKREGADQCEFCHIDKTGREGPVVHHPVANGRCTDCHDPHGGPTKTLLKAETERGLCLTCHAKTAEGKHVHGPVALDCTPCHTAHTSDFPKLLSMERQALCLSCHQQVAEEVGTFKHPHAPAAKDCLQCHNPHSSDQPMVLTAPAAELCTTCHQAVSEAAKNSSHPHSAATSGKACLNCHTAHGSDRAHLMRGSTVSACLECHKLPIKLEGRTVAGVPEIGVEANFKHGPIRQDDCTGCHDVHGGGHAKLLVEPFSPKFSMPFKQEDYALCFKCHDKGLVSKAAGAKPTGFRDGDRNLHWVHVVNPANGRSCRSCHALHASHNEMHLADTVPYGQWSLPINFKQTETGGSCAPGCHTPQSYSRTSPGPAATPPAAVGVDGAGAPPSR